jgi:Domain of unknown function (DUF5615)
MARLYADANFPHPTVEKLRRLGHDVVTVQQTEGTSRPKHGMEDALVLELATSEKRCVLTLNRTHFEMLHEEHPGHYGIIVCKADQKYLRQAKLVDATIRSRRTLNGQLFYVSRPVKRKRKKQ